MTKGQLQDITLLRMGMDTQDRRYDPRVVFSVMDSVRSSAIPDYITTYGESALELFCVPAMLPVLIDKGRNMKYVQLTFQILGMRDRTGLISVGLSQDDDNCFVPIQLGMQSVYSGLEAGGAAGNQTYFLEGLRVYMPGLGAGIDKILIKSIPTIYDLLNDDDQVPQPAEFNELMIMAAMEKLAPQGVVPIQDKTNDGRAGV
jgi:hypothetical protein